MKTKISVSLILILILSVISCTQSDDENNDNPFSFKITVKDTLENPIEGFEVFLQNKISLFSEERIDTRSLTIIVYKLSQECNVKLEIFDLNNTLVNTLINEERSAGTYFYGYSADNYDSGEPIQGGCIILKCNIIATDIETQEVLYDETKFMCRYNLMDIIGSTDSNGIFYTNNNLFFPHLYDLPEMEYIDELGEILGTFILKDTIEITIYDPVTETYQTFDRVVEEENNNFDLVWDSNQNRSDINNISNSTYNNENRSVEISSFYALYIGSTPTIYWVTQAEIDNEYWNVYRGTNNNFTEAIHLNVSNPVPGNGTTNNASEYVYVDTEPVIQYTTYWYWIEDVSTDDETEVHGPIVLTIPFSQEWDLNNFPNPFN